MEIRNATRADFEQYYGYPPAYSFRGVVGLEDGEFMGIGGVLYEGDIPRAFMDLKFDPREGRKKDLIRGIRAVIKQMRENNQLVLAVVNGGENLVGHFGFERLYGADERVWVWK